jgi:hypothetical protein
MKNNLQPDVWGPHGWKFIHYVALGYPDKPTDADKTAYRNFYESLSDILPCQGCADHYRETIQAFPVKDHLASRDQLLRWSFDIHNTVNKRIGKSILSYDEALQLYTRKQFPRFELAGKCLLVVGLLVLLYLVLSSTSLRRTFS